MWQATGVAGIKRKAGGEQEPHKSIIIFNLFHRRLCCEREFDDLEGIKLVPGWGTAKNDSRQALLQAASQPSSQLAARPLKSSPNCYTAFTSDSSAHLRFGYFGVRECLRVVGLWKITDLYGFLDFFHEPFLVAFNAF